MLGAKFLQICLGCILLLQLLSVHTVMAFSPRPLVFLETGLLATPSRATFVSSRIYMADKEGGPAVLDRPETIEKVQDDEATKEDQQSGSEGWEIRLYNDPFNKREFVARCLATICGKSDTESYQIMMEAHNNGMGIIGRYRFELAELYHNSLRENGLMVDMVPVDDE